MVRLPQCTKLLISLIVILCVTSAIGRPPNILMLVVDDLRPALRTYGNHVVHSPNINRLVRVSTRFQNAHCQFAVCGPSRTSFLTSRRPDTLGVFDQHLPYWRTRAGNFTSLPQFFKESEHQYYTVSLGKVFHPSGLSGHTDDYPYSWTERPYHPSSFKYENNKLCSDEDGKLHSNVVCPVKVASQPEQTLPDIQTARTALDKLAKLSSMQRPFLLAVGFHKPHVPFRYPHHYDDLYKLSEMRLAVNHKKPSGLPSVAWNPFMHLKSRDDVSRLNISFPYGQIPEHFQKKLIRSYYASVSYLDDMVGQVLAGVDKNSLWNNTIIVLLSDHGWSLGEHGEWAKFSNYDIATRVPLSIYTPPSVMNTSSANVYKMVELVDLFPTLVELAGFRQLKQCTDTSTTTCTEGQSLVPLMKGEKSRNAANASFSQYPRPSLLPQPNSDTPSARDIRYMGYAIKTTRYRYVMWISFNSTTMTSNLTDIVSEELYDIYKDPGENENLVEYLPSKGRELQTTLRAKWLNYGNNC